MKPNSNVFASLDIGTTKIVCVVSVLDSGGKLCIMGIGIGPSDGLRKGVVANIDKTASSIKLAVEAAGRMADVEVGELWVGLSGSHIRSFTSSGMVVLKRKNSEITGQDRAKVIEAASAVSLPRGSAILHAIPQEFIIDGEQGIEQPVGMAGERLETRVYICTCPLTSVQSTHKSVKKAGFKVAGIVLAPLAASYAVIDESEKKFGAALVDMGGEATNIALYSDGNISHIAVVESGCNAVTSDIARVLHLTAKTAEEIKVRYGNAGMSLPEGDTGVPLPGIGGRGEQKIPLEKLAAIIRPKLEEIFTKAREEIVKAGYDKKLEAGIVLTGGGALLKGAAALAEKIFEKPVRIGVPSNVVGLVEIVRSPAYATIVGLCLYAAEQAQEKKETAGMFAAAGRFKKSLDKAITKLADFFK